MSNNETDLLERPAGNGDPDRSAFLEAVSSGDVDLIRQSTRRLLGNASSPARAARLIRGTLQATPCEKMKPFRIALLSSFSIELVQDPLVAHGYTEGLAIEVYQPGYDQYHQEILSPDSGLYRSKPDAIILAVDGPRWAPDLYDDFLRADRREGDRLADSAVARVDDLVGNLRRHTKAPLLLHSLAYPRHSALGILDATEKAGQRHLIARANSGLAALSREHSAVYLVDIDAVIQSAGYGHWHDPRLDYFARSPIARSALDGLARYYLRYLRALSGNSRKCLIVDLDNTLWGGIVGEEGPLAIALGSEYPGNAYLAFQKSLLALRDRGVILAIASKNNIHDVEQAFAENSAMLLSLDDFSAKQIHWEPKSVSIARIAETLNLGLRHIVFLDDNPAECIEVEQAHPAVTVLRFPERPERFEDVLLADGLFDSLQVSDEDSRRAELYQQRDAAEKMRTETTSMEDYYRSLQMRLYLGPITAENLTRASQMTRKTTQFNTTTRLYSEADLNALMSDEKCKTLIMRVVDRFGDNGIVGLLLARRHDDTYDIDICLMSCRVINRGVETAMLFWLAESARNEGVDAIEGWIRPTDRNLPVRDLYERHGFTAAETPDEGVKWRLELPTESLDLPDWLEIFEETGR